MSGALPDAEAQNAALAAQEAAALVRRRRPNCERESEGVLPTLSRVGRLGGWKGAVRWSGELERNGRGVLMERTLGARIPATHTKLLGRVLGALTRGVYSGRTLGACARGMHSWHT